MEHAIQTGMTASSAVLVFYLDGALGRTDDTGNHNLLSLTRRRLGLGNPIRAHGQHRRRHALALSQLRGDNILDFDPLAMGHVAVDVRSPRHGLHDISNLKTFFSAKRYGRLTFRGMEASTSLSLWLIAVGYGYEGTR